MENTRINKNCRDCNKPFSISEEEMKWLEERGFQPFSRCSGCRKKNNERNAATKKIASLVEWVQKRQADLYDLQTRSQSEEEHNARDAHITDLGDILARLS